MKKIVLIPVIILSLIIVLILVFFIYLKYFWSLQDADFSKITSYEYLSNTYKENANKFQCVERLSKKSHSIKLIRFNKKTFTESEHLDVYFDANNELTVYPSLQKYVTFDGPYNMQESSKKKYESLDNLLGEYGIDKEMYICLQDIIHALPPFWVVSFESNLVKFSVRGAFEVGYGIMYYFDSGAGQEIDRQFKGGMTGIIRSRHIQDSWYTFVER